MKKNFKTFGVFSLLFFWSLAQAGIPRDSITNITTNVYGLYTTADPTCQTGLKATVPLEATPRTVNMAGKPDLGQGPMANPPNCVVMIMKNVVSVVWASGSYTSTTSGLSDNVCNSGGNVTINLCRSLNVDFPIEIQNDAKGKLTLTTTCPASPTGNEVVAVFLSTNSKCTSNIALDTNISGCLVAGQSANNSFLAPLALNDTTRGINLIAPPPGKKKYKFVLDPDKIVGNQGGACANTAAPRFSFAEDTDL